MVGLISKFRFLGWLVLFPWALAAFEYGTCSKWGPLQPTNAMHEDGTSVMTRQCLHRWYDK